MLLIVIKSLKKMLSEKEINELKVKVLIEAPLLYPEWRKGQAYFNYLYQLHPDVADEIKADYKTEDEYLEYLFSLIYNLENKLGNLLDSSSDENK